MSNIDDLIQTVESEIADLRKTLTRKKDELQSLKRNKTYQGIEEYEKKYKEHPQKTIQDYVKLLEENSYQGGEGYKVSCPGYNFVRARSHWVLKPDCREKCIPSEKILEAL